MTAAPAGAAPRCLGRPLPPPDLLGLHDLHGCVLVRTARGSLPLYRFTPLQAALLFGEAVPSAAHWPEHLKLFLYQYVPLPPTATVCTRLPGQVGTRERGPHGLRPWEHTTYQGWPLYLYAHDQPGHTPRGEIQHLFSLVHTDQAPLLGPDQSAHGP
ncbi:hypothetical protein LAJ19_02010 [Deinococcus taeanensis]|uniref:hypothetical protein n=1 Tax=Deinococcus taeanensis TaxID=2737050 RepID=UPI001CDBA603|nr:hypothetical protein [Deinococcus taeanensis]UBV43022.1 hypothetical protein LAJ19_02010 [Deinococcus taeanensis]